MGIRQTQDAITKNSRKEISYSPNGIAKEELRWVVIAISKSVMIAVLRLVV